MHHPHISLAYKRPTTRKAREDAKARCERLRNRLTTRHVPIQTETAFIGTLTDTVTSLRDLVQTLASSINDLRDHLPPPARNVPASSEKPLAPGAPLRFGGDQGNTPECVVSVVGSRPTPAPSPVHRMESLEEVARQAAEEIANEVARANACQRVSRNARGIPQRPSPRACHKNKGVTATSKARTKITARKSVAFLNSNIGSQSSTKVKSEFTPVGSRGGTLKIPTPPFNFVTY